MTVKKRQLIDLNRAELDDYRSMMPSDVRDVVEAMRLRDPLSDTLMKLARASWSERLAECAAEAQAYAFTAWHYGEISESQWRLVRDHIASCREDRRAEIE